MVAIFQKNKPIKMNEFLQIALRASIDAGTAIMEIYSANQYVEFKSDRSPLTLADKRSNEMIRNYLHETSIPVTSEENKTIPYEIRKNWNECWIVDPLDGTKEFIKRNGEFTVNIALIRNSRPVFGVIYVPPTKELYFGDVEKKIARKVIVNGQVDMNSIIAESQLLKAAITKKQRIRVVGSRSHMNEETSQFMEELKEKYNETEIISKGSSLKFCMAAEGKADIYPRFAPTMEWDTAAGDAICRAVGLKVVSRETGQLLLYNKESLLNPSFLVYKDRI